MRRTPVKLAGPVLSLALAAGAVAQQPFFALFGASSGDRLGASCSSAGDIDGDGLADAIVGSPDADAGGIDAGAVRVVSGADGSVLWAFTGDAAGDRLGHSVSGAGDVDGDGFDDFVVGAPGDDTNGDSAGSVRVYSGLDGSVLYTFYGDGPQDELGAAVGAAGDADRDGFADVIAGAPGDDDAGPNAGSARVYSGKDGSVLYTFHGDDGLDRFGWSVSGAGDVDGDGYGDVVVGAPWSDVGGTEAGRVHVFSGIDGAELFTADGADPRDHFGWSVFGGADIDDDGTPDVVVGIPLDDCNGTDSGCVVVLSGVDGSVLHEFPGEAAFDHFGWSVAAGETDGDTHADVVAGAPLNDTIATDAGGVRVFSGASGEVLLRFDGPRASDSFGWSVGAGDMDGDGFVDVIAGIPDDDTQAAGAGRVQVFTSKPFDALAEVLSLNPGSTGARFGSAVAAVGDVDLDGIPDYAIGAPWDVGTLGSVRVYSGAAHSVLHTFFGTGFDIFYGARVAPAGDLDRDGHPDIAVGAMHDATLFPAQGAVHVYSGRTGAPLRSMFGPSPQSHFGSAVGSVGDVNGDGVRDLLVGVAQIYTDDGAVWMMSGATGTRLYEVRGETKSFFGWAAATLGDIDGDGYDDFVVGAPALTSVGAGYAKVLSGINGATIWRFDGLANGDQFGLVARQAGDVNADGVMDIIVGGFLHDLAEKADAGMARVFSGADGSLLYHLTGSAAGDEFGVAVGPAGDVNGDNFDDFFVGAGGASPNGLARAGSAYLFSGRDGTVLQRFDGATAGGEYGRAVHGIGDINGDTYADAIVGAPFADAPSNDSGLAVVLESQVKSNPGSALNFGASCLTSNGRLPHLAFRGRPAIGRTFQTGLTTATPSTAVALGFDATRRGIAMDVIGAPGCTLLALPLISLPATTDAVGEARLQLAVPALPSIVGGTLYAQWAIIDAPANPLGLVMSDGGRVIVGRP